MAMIEALKLQQYFASFAKLKISFVMEMLVFNVGLPVMFISLWKLLISEEEFNISVISKLYLILLLVVLTCQYLPFKFSNYFSCIRNYRIFVYGIVLPLIYLSLHKKRLQNNDISDMSDGEKQRLENFKFINENCVFYILGLDVTDECLHGSIRRWYIQVRCSFPKFVKRLEFVIIFLFLLCLCIMLFGQCITRVLHGFVFKYNSYSLASITQELNESNMVTKTQHKAIHDKEYKKTTITHHGTRETVIETPLVCEKHYRRSRGEDIELDCTWTLDQMYTLEMAGVAVREYTKWTRKDNNEYDLGQIRNTKSKKNQQMDSFSRILINSTDFGVYYLWYSKKYKDGVHSFLVGKFILEESKLVTHNIYVPVGSFMILGNHIFHTFANISDLTVVYNVHSFALGTINLTSSVVSSKCTSLTNVLKKIVTTNNDNYTVAYTYSVSCKLINGGRCISSKLYGIHYLSIVRKLYEETSTGRRFTAEIEIILRHRYNVFPGRPWMNFLYETKQVSAKNNRPSISNIIEEEGLWTVRQGIEKILILFFGVVFLPWVFITLCKCVDLKGFFGKVEIVEGEHFSDFVDDIEYFKEIDCLLISAENERQYNNLVSSCLEGEKLKVCIPDRDFDVNTQPTKLYSQAISTALTFVIICSKDLVADRFLNSYVIRDMILNRLDDKTIMEKNLVLIKTDNERLPLYLKRYKHVKCFDFSKSFLKDSDKRNLILEWAKYRLSARLKKYTIPYRMMNAVLRYITHLISKIFTTIFLVIPIFFWIVYYLISN